MRIKGWPYGEAARDQAGDSIMAQELKYQLRLTLSDPL
jgi:hypothetical protein